MEYLNQYYLDTDHDYLQHFSGNYHISWKTISLLLLIQYLYYCCNIFIIVTIMNEKQDMSWSETPSELWSCFSIQKVFLFSDPMSYFNLLKQFMSTLYVDMFVCVYVHTNMCICSCCMCMCTCLYVCHIHVCIWQRFSVHPYIFLKTCSGKKCQAQWNIFAN